MLQWTFAVEVDSESDIESDSNSSTSSFWLTANLTNDVTALTVMVHTCIYASTV